MQGHNKYWRLLSGFPKKKIRKIEAELFTSDNSRMIPQIETELFTSSECKKIISSTTSLNSTYGTAGNKVRNERNSSIMWLIPTVENEWIFSRLEKFVRKANVLYKFDLAGFLEPLQLGCYESGGHYEWHMDNDGFSHRKISISVQLSLESNYEGGYLEFMDGPHTRQAPRVQGTAVAFPSYFLHRVTPVTQGVRYSLVVWVGGLPYK